MKPFAVVAAFVGIWLVAGADLPELLPVSGEEQASAVWATLDSSPEDRAPTPATLTEVVGRYCVTCHNEQLMTGNLSLQAFDVDAASEHAETAERMIRKLRAGMMPPPGMPRPSGDTLQALVETIEFLVVLAV